MKILHFFKTYYPDAYGGVQQVIYQLAEGAVKRGHEVDVLCLSAENAGRNFNIANHSVHAAKEDFYIASTGFSWSAIVEFRRLAEKADVIHYHFPWPYMDLGSPAGLARINPDGSELPFRYRQAKISVAALSSL